MLYTQNKNNKQKIIDNCFLFKYKTEEEKKRKNTGRTKNAVGGY
jgi:hypothetical protein